jgi:uncharacterized protein (TIRG00374 family)
MASRAAALLGNRGVIWIVRTAVSAIVLALIFHFVSFATVWKSMRMLPPALWLAALALFLCGHALAAAKWRLLIGAEVSFAKAFRAHLAGLGANLALPGVAGGDVVRAGMVIGLVRDRGRLAVGSLADRLIDTLGLLLITLAGAFFAWHPALGATSLYLRTVVVLIVVGIILVFALAGRVDALLKARANPGKLLRIASKIMGAVADLTRQPGRLALCLVLSMIVQCLFVAINIALAHAVGLDVPNAAWFYAWSGSKIIAIAPISLGGLGVREASMAALLRPFHANAGDVIAVGLIWQTILYASGIIGIIVQSLFSGGPAKDAAHSTSTPNDVVKGQLS